VPVTVLCSAGSSGFVQVDVTEAVGPNIASGSGSASVECTGGFQQFDITVVSNTSPFRIGRAFATARIGVCDDTGCLSNTDQRDIRIVRR
jgi:hypothetical protein